MYRITKEVNYNLSDPTMLRASQLLDQALNEYFRQRNHTNNVEKEDMLAG